MDQHPSSVASEWTGQRLSKGRYLVERKLAEGGMAVIYVAQDQVIGSKVVIKAPHAELLKEKDFDARFTREIRSLLRLSHPHILKVLDVGQHRDIPFVVLQYLAGGSLRDRQQRLADDRAVPMAPESLHDWLPDMASTLDYIHQRGYLHRDVKPDNLLFDEKGNVYLGNFGVAKVLGDQRPESQRTVMTDMGTTIGTPQYMAPELILAKKFDQRVEQYALAVTVYELLSGRYPFGGSNPTAIFVEQMKTTPPALHTLASAIPKELSAVVEKALSKEPRNRFPSCTAFANSIRTALPATVLEAERIGEVLPVETASAMTKTAKGSPMKSDQRKSQVLCPHCGAPIPVSATLPPGATLHCSSCQIIFFPTAPADKYNTPKPLVSVTRSAHVETAKAIHVKRTTKRQGKAEANASMANSMVAFARQSAEKRFGGHAWHIGVIVGILTLASCGGVVGISLLNRAVPRRGDMEKEVPSAKPIAVQTEKKRTPLVSFAVRYTVGKLAFSPDGKRLVGAGDSTCTVWDAVTGQELRTIQLPDGAYIECMNYDLTLLASLNRSAPFPSMPGLAPEMTNENRPSIKIWDLTNGNLR